MKITKLFHPFFNPFWGPRFQAKYGFELYQRIHDKKKPLIVFGCYGGGTKTDLMNHEGLIVIVWSGSDSTRLHERGDFVKYCLDNADRVFHIAHSHWIQTDLAHFGLKFIDKVVIPTKSEDFSFEKQPGTAVYHYGVHPKPWQYGTDIINRLEKKWGQSNRFPRIHKTVQAAYGQSELYEMYKGSFVGVRLTEHDNMSMSAIEMALMGRRTIFNGNIPGAIPWPTHPYDKYDPMTRVQRVTKTENLVGAIERLILEAPREPDPLLSEEMREFVYDDLKWLDTNFYG